MTSHILAWAAIGLAVIWAVEIVAFIVAWSLWSTGDRHQRSQKRTDPVAEASKSRR